MTTELVNQGSNDLVTQEWGSSAVSSSDIVIPRIIPMQGMSKLVTEGKAKFGDFRESMNGDLVGSVDKPLEFIPFHFDKTWILYTEEKDNKGKIKKTFSGVEPCVPANENMPWEEKLSNGNRILRDKTINVYVLLADELKTGMVMPYIISFKRTSYKGGMKLLTQCYTMNRAANLSPAAFVMKLVGKKVQNDDGTYVVVDVEKGRKATKEEELAALNWFKTVKSGGAKVDTASDEIPF